MLLPLSVYGYLPYVCAQEEELRINKLNYLFRAVNESLMCSVSSMIDINKDVFTYSNLTKKDF